MATAVQTVKPDKILGELSKLWVDMAKHGPEDVAAEPLRACAMTLIVFVDDEADEMALGETLKGVMRVHPSRAIVVRLREAPGTLESRVFAQCWLPTGNQRQICCEQVEISVSLDRLEDLPTIISPLAAPDVPRVIWFHSSRIASAPDVGELLTLGDKIVVDSAQAGSPAFADLRVLTGAGYMVADLAWTRLTRIRELLAQLLDGHDLAAIRAVTIEYGGPDACPEAKYLQAWLRSELTGASVNLKRSDATGKGEVTGIRIEPELNVRVSANCADYDTGSLQQRANLSGCEEHEVLSEELSIMTRDHVFERALQRMTVWNPRS